MGNAEMRSKSYNTYQLIMIHENISVGEHFITL